MSSENHPSAAADPGGAQNGTVTTMQPSGRRIRHNLAARRFEYQQDGLLCVMDYVLDGKTAAFTHTGVPPALEGRGIAADLVRCALETARQQGWQVLPRCSYVAAYLQRHPEYGDVLAPA